MRLRKKHPKWWRERREQEAREDAQAQLEQARNDACTKIAKLLKMAADQAKAKDKKGPTFSRIPNIILASDAYTQLSSGARDLLLYARFKFSGGNNGRIALTLTALQKEWGWKHAKKYRANALAELLDAGLLKEEREPATRRVGLYSVAWEQNLPNSGRKK